ncbi:Major facilitator superfamily domain, general substrate transporter [Coniochaeta hoffmannii]|uniref:Major facilitator superfamily domain, general substrate transporter n=1 Tax=Coniochaeta hoffmannii TaxID=91930 RepID=A0AA38RRH6_9PEZI|nr:Major facilitator superfamily domain, general substrate transporter [Coniochaeta hoffmannii]
MAELTHGTDYAGLMLKDMIPTGRKPWYRDVVLIRLNLLLMCALLTQTATGFDASMLNGMQSLPQWTHFFGHPEGSRLGAMTFGPTGGVLISVLVSSQLCDRFGRRYPICGGSLIIILGSVIQAAAQNYGMFVAARFLVGFGLGIVSVAAPPLLSEVAYPTHRGKLVSFYLCSWPLGSLIAAWVTFGTFKMQNQWAWRLPSLLQCAFSVVQAILSLLAPESPRWLIYQNRPQEALEILAKYHGNGDRNSELVKFEMSEISATLEMEKLQRQSRWREWISTKGNLHRLFLALYIPAMMQWSGNALISYYLTIILKSIGITDSRTQLIINGCLSIWGFSIAVIFAMLVDRAGRRSLWLAGMSGMLLSYIIWTICSAINQQTNFEHKGYAGAVIAMIFLYQLFYHVCSPVATTYIMEVVPYSLRSKASMMYQLSGNLAGVYNSFANPVAMKAITWKYYIVWVVIITIHLTVMWFFFPETKGLGLEEVAVIFDGPDALSAGPNAMHLKGKDWDIKEAAVETAEAGDRIDGSSEGGNAAADKVNRAV